MPEIDTFNRQAVGRAGPNVVVLVPRAVMTREEALVHAAHIVAIAEETEGQFARILEAVQGT
jgi:hypothetical protein